MDNTNAIITFIKNVELGVAKTRIAKTVGQEKANEVYHQLLEITRKVTERVGADKYVYYSNFISENDQWFEAGFNQRLQNQGGLGDRIKSALEEIFDHHEKGLIVGSDCPYITVELVQSAFDLLDKVDLVIGPAEDGGYYLLASNHYEPSLFENINWSTSTVLEETLAKAKSLNLSYSLLPGLSDIDYWEDWQLYLDSLVVSNENL